MNGKKQVSGLIKFIPFICTSATWGCPFSLFLSFLSPAPQQSLSGGGSITWIAVWGTSFTFGGWKLLLWHFLFMKMAGDISFHSTSYLRCIHHFFFNSWNLPWYFSGCLYVSILVCQWILSIFFFFKLYQLFLLWVSVKIFSQGHCLSLLSSFSLD